MKPIIVLDIDGTILHSRRGFTEGDVCMELINHECRGFMRASVYETLTRVLTYVEIAVVTTRSIEQYRRIEWGNIAPSFAYADCGATLVYPDETIYVGNIPSGRCLKDMNRLSEGLRRHECVKESRVVDDCYIIAILHNENEAPGLFSSVDSSMYQCHICRTKAYVLPKGLSKELAINDLQRKGYYAALCAGDDVLDIPMLKLSDVSVVPARYSGLLSDSHAMIVSVSDDENFEEYVAKTIANTFMKGRSKP